MVPRWGHGGQRTLTRLPEEPIDSGSSEAATASRVYGAIPAVRRRLNDAAGSSTVTANGSVPTHVVPVTIASLKNWAASWTTMGKTTRLAAIVLASRITDRSPSAVSSWPASLRYKPRRLRPIVEMVHGRAPASARPGRDRVVAGDCEMAVGRSMPRGCTSASDTKSCLLCWEVSTRVLLVAVDGSPSRVSRVVTVAQSDRSRRRALTC